MSDLNQIKAARETYKKNGILVKSVLTPEIAISWERSNILSRTIDQSFIKKMSTDRIEVLSEAEIEKIMPNAFNHLEQVSLFVTDRVGNIIKARVVHPELNQLKTLQEKYIGSTAFSMTIRLNKAYTLDTYEHYNELFDSFVSSCEITNNGNSYWTVFTKKQEGRMNHQYSHKWLQHYLMNHELLTQSISREILCVKKEIRNCLTNKISFSLDTTSKRMGLNYLIEGGADRHFSKIVVLDEGSIFEDHYPTITIEQSFKKTLDVIVNLNEFDERAQIILYKRIAELQPAVCLLNTRSKYTWGNPVVENLSHVKLIPKIKIPPLNTRPEDIQYLISTFEMRNELSINSEIKIALKKYEYTSCEEELIMILENIKRSPSYRPVLFETKTSSQICSVIESKKNLVREVMLQTNGNISKSAKILNISRSTLYRYVKELENFN